MTVSMYARYAATELCFILSISPLVENMDSTGTLEAYIIRQFSAWMLRYGKWLEILKM